MTHAYFCFYHTLSNIVLRRLGHAIKGCSYPVRLAANTIVVVAFSYFTAFMETLTITHVSRPRIVVLSIFLVFSGGLQEQQTELVSSGRVSVFFFDRYEICFFP